MDHFCLYKWNWPGDFYLPACFMWDWESKYWN